MRISYWSSDVCSSDLRASPRWKIKSIRANASEPYNYWSILVTRQKILDSRYVRGASVVDDSSSSSSGVLGIGTGTNVSIDNSNPAYPVVNATYTRSEEHTSELQSLMRISYAVFCLQK